MKQAVALACGEDELPESGLAELRARHQVCTIGWCVPVRIGAASTYIAVAPFFPPIVAIPHLSPRTRALTHEEAYIDVGTKYNTWYKSSA